MTREVKFSLTAVLAGGKQTGGGYFQALSALRALVELLPEEISLTVLDARGTFSEEIEELCRSAGTRPFTTQSLPKRLSTFRDRVMTDSNFRYQFLRFILRMMGHDIQISRLARFLDNSPTDLVYFLSPAPEAGELSIKPYIWTLWDLFHLDHPEFPELRTSGKFEAREKFNSLSIRKAAAIVVDSATLVQKAEKYFGANPDKFVVVPYSIPTSRNEFGSTVPRLPREVESIKKQYFLYPAQLWTHKNHQRIVEAIQDLNDGGLDIHAVFVGRNHGAGESLMRVINSRGMQDKIHVLGYVEDGIIPSLYSESLGLVMASYVGPNIPPLEALKFGVPIIATTVHQDQLSGAALYFNPDSWEELAHQMRELMDPTTRERLVSEGQIRLEELNANREIGHVTLQKRILLLSRRMMLAQAN